MIGNDIVDLALARKQSNWKRKGFLDKIFTISEQYLILNSKKQDVTVWNLWSRKEAAYKIFNRKTGIRVYNPLEFECFDLEITDGIILGKVINYNAVYYTKTIISEEFVHTVAVLNILDFDTIYYLENSETIIKKEGVPYSFDEKRTVLKPASISHHGRFTKIIAV